MNHSSAQSVALPFVEDVEVAGHIIDSLLLPKILDAIMAHKGSFEIRQITVGQRRVDPSYALVQVQAESEEQLAFLRKNGCEEFQGFLFSRPLPAEEIQKVLEKNLRG